MTTVLFVHGISVRQRHYNVCFNQIEAYLRNRGAQLDLAPCIWGDTYGAELKGGGASIPAGSSAKGLDEPAIDEEIGQWQALYADPLCELRLWSLRDSEAAPFDPLGRKSPQQLLDERIQALAASDRLSAIIHQEGLDQDAFHKAKRGVTSSPAYVDALQAVAADELNDFAVSVARSIVAAMIAETLSDSNDLALSVEDMSPISADVRDEMIELLASELSNQTKGHITNWLTRAVSALGTRYVTGSRTFFSSAIVPYVGDILRYQGAGQAIRDLIRERIAGCRPPIVLLAHSLGGVACVELLAAESLPEVELLVTVGSQAPFFYEMDALASLPFGSQLPEHFPQWLNIYDRCDFLSFVGGSVFERPGRLEDIEVSNRQPFPWSHTSYWSNGQMWDAIFARLPQERS